MKKIGLDGYASFKKEGHSSKGDQRKWLIDNVWYKVDYMGYEGLSESVVSTLLQKSTIRYPFVQYDLLEFEKDGNTFHGCASANFLDSGWILLPLEKIYRMYTGESIALRLVDFDTPIERIKFLVNAVESITKIPNFGNYLTTILEIDAFFMNEDRHTNNLAVLYNGELDEYRLCPIFDQGLALFSDTTIDYSLDKTLDDCLKKIEAKPFSLSFDDQLDAAEELYGIQLHFGFTKKEVDEAVDAAVYYDNAIKTRVKDLIHRQMRKYQYLMDN